MSNSNRWCLRRNLHSLQFRTQKTKWTNFPTFVIVSCLSMTAQSISSLLYLSKHHMPPQKLNSWMPSVMMKMNRPEIHNLLTNWVYPSSKNHSANSNLWKEVSEPQQRKKNKVSFRKRWLRYSIAIATRISREKAKLYSSMTSRIFSRGLMLGYKDKMILLALHWIRD